MTSGDLNIDLTSVKVGDLVAAYLTPFAVCRYVALLSRSQGGVESAPPRDDNRGSQQPDDSRFKRNARLKKSDYRYNSHMDDIFYQCQTQSHTRVSHETMVKNKSAPNFDPHGSSGSICITDTLGAI